MFQSSLDFHFNKMYHLLKQEEDKKEN